MSLVAPARALVPQPVCAFSPGMQPCWLDSWRASFFAFRRPCFCSLLILRLRYAGWDSLLHSLPMVMRPAERGHEICRSQVMHAPLPSRRVLVADDNEDAAEATADVLRLGGYEVMIAYDGKQAVKVARVFQPDVAILDINMPVMDGYEVALEIDHLLRKLDEVLAAGHVAS
jgi:hypothetical protein